MKEVATILVTGAGGQLGSEFKHLYADDPLYDWHFFDRKELDISNQAELSKTLKQLNPDFFINCAAYTAVDKAETEVEKCFLINEYSVGLIAQLCANEGVKLIHFSSDYVYHIDKDSPLLETDPTLPNGIYAQSKLAGECLLLKANVEHIILRTSWVYSSFGKNFIKTVLRIAREKKEMSVVNDQIGTLTYARDLARTTYSLLGSKDQGIWNQIYNFSSNGKSSWFEIANFIVEKMELDLKISPIHTIEYITPATRPLWSLMSKAKISKKLNIDIPSWQTTLEKSLPLFDK